MSSDEPKKKTGSGPNPVSEEELKELLWRRLTQNRGGRPRKDGSRADTRLTWKQAGFSKRDAARIREYARVAPEAFEAALEQWHAEVKRGGRNHALEYFLPDRRANTRLERATQSNIARLRSTLRRLERDYEGDGSETGEAVRALVKATRELWGFEA